MSKFPSDHILGPQDAVAQPFGLSTDFQCDTKMAKLLLFIAREQIMQDMRRGVEL